MTTGYVEKAVPLYNKTETLEKQLDELQDWKTVAQRVDRLREVCVRVHACVRACVRACLFMHVGRFCP